MAPLKTTPKAKQVPLQSRVRGGVDWLALYRRTVEKFPKTLERLGR